MSKKPSDHTQNFDNELLVDQFLKFLDNDMDKNPQRIQPISSEVLNRLRALVSDIEIDLDAPLLETDE